MKDNQRISGQKNGQMRSAPTTPKRSVVAPPPAVPRTAHGRNASKK